MLGTVGTAFREGDEESSLAGVFAFGFVFAFVPWQVHFAERQAAVNWSALRLASGTAAASPRAGVSEISFGTYGDVSFYWPSPLFHPSLSRSIFLSLSLFIYIFLFHI